MTQIQLKFFDSEKTLHFLWSTTSASEEIPLFVACSRLLNKPFYMILPPAPIPPHAILVSDVPLAD
jgi:hypothetical protein